MNNQYKGRRKISRNDCAADGQADSSGISPELFAQYAAEFELTESALSSFLRILEQKGIPLELLDSKLRELAKWHQDLLVHFLTVGAGGEPEIYALKKQVAQVLKEGDYAKAEKLLSRIEKLDGNALGKLQESIAEQQAMLERRRISSAANRVEQARLLQVQGRSVQAAKFWQEAADLLPEGRRQERAKYLNGAGRAHCRAANYAAALNLCEQSLSIFQAIGDWQGERAVLDSISHIHEAQGDYEKALRYLKQSMLLAQKKGCEQGDGAISRIYHAQGNDETALSQLRQSLILLEEVGCMKGEGTALNELAASAYAQGDHAAALQYYEQSLTLCRQLRHKRGEGAILNNISAIYYAQENYDAALKHLEESLAILREIGDRTGEGATLNNIATTAYAKGDSSAALKYLKQSLSIAEKTGAKEEQAVISGNIGMIYKDRSEFPQAELYLSRAVELEKQLEHADMEEWRRALEEVRALLRG